MANSECSLFMLLTRSISKEEINQFVLCLMQIILNIYMFSEVSTDGFYVIIGFSGFVRFSRRFISSFGAIFKRGGGLFTWSLSLVIQEPKRQENLTNPCFI